jgi:hypothetical protein
MRAEPSVTWSSLRTGQKGMKALKGIGGSERLRLVICHFQKL